MTIAKKPVRKTTRKPTPLKDGSGQGRRANKGRGGCPPSQQRKSKA